MEEWRDIKGYEGLYQVSNLGNVKGLDRLINSKNGKKYIYHGKMLKKSIVTDGYESVKLCKDGEHVQFKIHRLVAEAFIPNPDNLPCVNHMDENKLNNCVDNLEWCDKNYNNNYGTRNERISKTLSKPVVQMDLEGNVIGVYLSVIDIKRKLNYSTGYICECCNGKFENAYGYKWEYLN